MLSAAGLTGGCGTGGFRGKAREGVRPQVGACGRGQGQGEVASRPVLTCACGVLWSAAARDDCPGRVVTGGAWQGRERWIGTFDYVIVGAGTAGCVLANRLSADPRTRVLLLEAGGKDSWIWIHIPIGYLYTQNNPRTDWCFQTEPEPGLNGRALNYPRGRVLGGCSSINGMIYMRGQARDYDGWRQAGNRGWGWDDVLPYFKKSEDHAAGADEMHGARRRVADRAAAPVLEILDAFRDAAAEVGIPKITDFNRGNNEGCAYFQVTQRRGVRWSTAKAFLRPARAGRTSPC